MSIALIGVMAMQYFFIRESYHQKAQIFDETVKASLSVVANKIERQEVYDFAREQQRRNQEKFLRDQELQQERQHILAEQVRIQNEINKLKTENFESIDRYRDEEEKLKREYPNAVYIDNEFFETYVRRPQYRHLLTINIQETFNVRELMTETSINVGASRAIPEVKAKDDSVRFIIPLIDPRQKVTSFVWATLPPKANMHVVLRLHELEKELRRLNEKKLAIATDLFDTIAVIGGKNQRLLEDIATSMAMSRKPLKDRIDTDFALRHLRAEFVQRGISSPFVMQVRTDPRSDFVIQAAYHVNNRELAEIRRGSEYSVPLFQGDQGNSPGLLTVYFPSRTSIIAGTMSYLVLPVVTLLVLLIGCFAYTLTIIFRQKKISEMKTDFINNMTHEFKTPVATIMIASESLRDPEIASDESRVNKLANIIYDENVRLGSHIERVLNIARLEKENLKIERTNVSVNTVVTAVLDSMDLQLQRAGGKITIELNAKDDMVVGDELHLSNVFFNLVDNAIKYSKDNPDITVRTFNNTKKSVCITVADKGIGMSKEHQEKIFDQFYRIPTGNLHNVKGFGLGLNYVSNIIKILNGKIAVKSEKDKGTQFEVILPLKNATTNDTVQLI